MKILLIDNYDSFTYNLFQYLKHFVSDVDVYRNDQISLPQIEKISPDKIVISAGPGHPIGAGISLDIVHRFGKSKSIFGVCLGHQVIAQAFGADIVKAEKPVHGKAVSITHDEIGIYSEIPQKVKVGLYHSLMIAGQNLNQDFIITSQSKDNIIMGIRHKRYKLEGVQFHPESILTEYGYKMIENWLTKA